MNKRGHGEGSIFYDSVREHWVAKLPRDELGRRARLVAPTRREAQRALRETLRQREAGVATTGRQITLGRFLDDWVQDTLPYADLAPRTVESYAATIRLHVNPSLGRVRLAALTPQHVQGFVREQCDAGKGPRTVQLAVAVLRIALTDAERWGLVSRNVARLVRTPGARPAERHPFTETEVAAILAAATGTRMYPLVIVARATGLRIAENLGLRWSNVDVEQRLIHVTHQLGMSSRRLEPLKTAASRRTVPLPVAAAEVLRVHQREQRAQADGSRYWQDHDLVFTTRVGTPHSQRNVHRSWTRLLEEAGVAHRGIHHLRHTYATALAEAGVNERAAQALLGHADSRTTREIYTHTTDRMMSLASELIDAGFQATLDTADQSLGSHLGSHELPEEVNREYGDLRKER